MNEGKEKKNIVLLSIIAIATLLVAVIGATFAYFQAQGGETVTRNVTIRTETADSTSYSIDKALTLNINQTNFYEGAGDVSSEAVTGIALFTASTGAGNDLCYTLDINVSSNNFIYTTDPDSNSGLHYVLNLPGHSNDDWHPSDCEGLYYDNCEGIWEALFDEGYIETDAETGNSHIWVSMAGKEQYDQDFEAWENDNNLPYPQGELLEEPEFIDEYGVSTFFEALVAAGYLLQVGGTGSPELVLTVTRATVENASDPSTLIYGNAVTIFDELDVTTLTGRIYIPATATATTVVTPTDKGDLGTFRYFDDANGALNIHKLTATAGKTTSHKYIATLTAINKDYDQEEITDKSFTGTLTFTTVSCDTPEP